MVICEHAAVGGNDDAAAERRHVQFWKVVPVAAKFLRMLARHDATAEDVDDRGCCALDGGAEVVGRRREVARCDALDGIGILSGLLRFVAQGLISENKAAADGNRLRKKQPEAFGKRLDASFRLGGVRSGHERD